VYQPGDSNYDIEAGFWMVIALDSTLTDDLIQEWMARDLVRAIQDARKEAEFNVEDRISLVISWSETESVVTHFWKYIETETLSQIHTSIDNADFEKITEISWEEITLLLKK
jgi:isoleucyl-tRNA synthetase